MNIINSFINLIIMNYFENFTPLHQMLCVLQTFEHLTNCNSMSSHLHMAYQRFSATLTCNLDMPLCSGRHGTVPTLL